MYTENQAIQKKRDTVQTSALEWIIAHLKALQSNIVNINTWVQQQQPKYYEFQVTFPTYWSEVGPAAFTITDPTGLATYHATYGATLSGDNGPTTLTYYPYGLLENVVPTGDSSKITAYRQMVTDIYTLSRQYNVFGLSAVYETKTGTTMTMHAYKAYQYIRIPPTVTTGISWLDYMNFALDFNHNFRMNMEFLTIDYASHPTFPTKVCIKMYATSTVNGNEFAGPADIGLLGNAAGKTVTFRLYYNENRAFDTAIPGNV